MNILFVCKHNRFRSKLAEGIFNKLDIGKKFKVKSAGIIKGYPVAKEVMKISKEKGIKVNRETNCFREEYLRWADIIIIVADNVPKNLFNHKKVVVWKIKDTNQENEKGIEDRYNKIEKLVEKFYKSIS